MTLGIFLKIFNLHDQECKRLDYLLTRTEDDIENEDEDVMNHIFFTEDKIAIFQDSLLEFTHNYSMALSLETNEDEARKLHEIYVERTNKVEDLIQKLVCTIYTTF